MELNDCGHRQVISSSDIHDSADHWSMISMIDLFASGFECSNYIQSIQYPASNGTATRLPWIGPRSHSPGIRMHLTSLVLLILLVLFPVWDHVFKGLCNLSMLQRKNVVRSGNSISAVELEQFWQWHRHVTSNVESSLADGPTMLVPLCTSRARYPHPPQLIEGWFLKIFRLAILCGIPNVEIKFERHQWS